MDWGGPTAPSGLLVYKTNYWIFGFSKAFLTWRGEGRSQIIWTLLSCYFMRAFLQQSAQSGHFSPKPDQLFKKNFLFSPKISPLFIPHSFTFLFRLSEFYIVDQRYYHHHSHQSPAEIYFLDQTIFFDCFDSDSEVIPLRINVKLPSLMCG